MAPDATQTNSQALPPAITAHDFSSVHDFVEERRQQMATLFPRVNPSQSLAGALENSWISEWLDAHFSRIVRALEATAHIDQADLDYYISRGGLAQCVAENIQMYQALAAQREQIAHLTTTLSEISRIRVAEGAEREAHDRIRLLAFDALNGLTQTDKEVPLVEEATQADAQGFDATALDSEIGIDMPETNLQVMAIAQAASMSEEDSATEVEGEEDKPRYALALPAGGHVMSAERFAAMAGVRGLTIQEGEAFPSDGRTYDDANPIDPAQPLPVGVTHVLWKEFAAA